MQSEIQSQIEAQVAEQIESEQTQKTNLEEKSHHKHHHKKAKKHHKKHHQREAQSLMQTAEAPKVAPVPVVKAAPKAAAPIAHPKPAPAAKNLIATKAVSQDEFDKFAQNVDVPIDEIKAITLKVSPTFGRDHVESVTLKSFRKVVGYDTFNSILKGDRAEKKDVSDHYNVTVSMMVRRIPAE